MKSLAEFKLEKLNVSTDFVYRGEGNSHVVISVPKQKKIIRISKIDRPNSIFYWLYLWFWDFIKWYTGKKFKEEIRNLEFYSKIIRPLLGGSFVSEAKPINLNRSQINLIAKRINKQRPASRKHKILQHGRATLFNDFAYINCNLPFKLSKNSFAIEIKPKQGWRPFREKCFPECLFCMKQYLKKDKNEIHQISKYCPEDLFSGNKEKMIRAIQAMVENPQNNFRMFQNGMFIYGDNSNTEISKVVQQLFHNNVEDKTILQNDFYDIIYKCLTTTVFTENVPEIKCKEKLFCQWNSMIQSTNLHCTLPKGCILDSILSAQMLDTEGGHYYYKLLGNNNPKDYVYVKLLLNELENYPETCLKCFIMMIINKNSSVESNDLIFAPYLISAIARDLSLMITLVKIEEETSDLSNYKTVIKTKFGNFAMGVGMFDLYPKPLSTIRKHFKRNAEIFEAYLKAKSEQAT